jgi:ELWxxDGT repeat protein
MKAMKAMKPKLPSYLATLAGSMAVGTLLLAPTSASAAWTFDPFSFTNVNGTLYFRAIIGTSGYELWKSDGTPAGTVLVKDINPGVNSSYPSNLTNVNGTLYFQANNGTNGDELWKSNGTEAGTVLVKDIYPGINSSRPFNPTNVNGTLYFRADNGSQGGELWKSDGTEGGTVLVKDINPGINSSDPYYLTNVNGTLYFRAFDPNYGRELWKSDGTTAGTTIVSNIAFDISDTGFSLRHSDPDYLTNANGTLFFSADGSRLISADRLLKFGRELYKSDGTTAGTVLLKDIVPGTGSSNPTKIASVGSTVYFGIQTALGDYELWKSNGTNATTVKVFP